MQNTYRKTHKIRVGQTRADDAARSTAINSNYKVNLFEHTIALFRSRNICIAPVLFCSTNIGLKNTECDVWRLKEALRLKSRGLHFE